MAALGARRALVFIGFMGAGKSKAVLAARNAGLEAVDVDELLARKLGMPIERFFAERGEEEFRAREAELTVAVLEDAANDAIALGGGAVLSEGVRSALERHVVAWLEVDPAEAWRRVEGSERPRPLARDRDAFERLLAERTPLYRDLADVILPAERELVARALPSLLALRDLPDGTRLAWATSASGDYPAFVGRGLLSAGPLAAVARNGGVRELAGRPFCVTDSTVGPLYAGALEPLAGAVEVGPGEQAKTLAEAERVLRELAGAGMTRSDHLVALGGGVIGDLAGFCASAYQRGVPIVHLPTTLVAQVDSAYGGKTGVDLPEAKNYVGAYHLPSAVIADPAVLETLPNEELAAGFVEVLKTALIAGGALWERVRAVESVDHAGLDDVIFSCARVKLEVVAADERDSGRRQVLNLGHTVGHAIEAASGYARYRHGEAVGLGLLAALRLSGTEELRDQVLETLVRHGLPVELSAEVDADAVIAALERDKKRDAEAIGFVLLERPGEPRVGERVDAASVRAAVDELYP